MFWISKEEGFSELHYTVPKLLLLDLTDNNNSVIHVISKFGF